MDQLLELQHAEFKEAFDEFDKVRKADFLVIVVVKFQTCTGCPITRGSP
jgi:predicted  nucleic acid-binding Zn-ribbon protein